jgi:hypothetical protein
MSVLFDLCCATLVPTLSFVCSAGEEGLGGQAEVPDLQGWLEGASDAFGLGLTPSSWSVLCAAQAEQAEEKKKQKEAAFAK